MSLAGEWLGSRHVHFCMLAVHEGEIIVAGNAYGGIRRHLLFLGILPVESFDIFSGAVLVIIGSSEFRSFSLGPRTGRGFMDFTPTLLKKALFFSSRFHSQCDGFWLTDKPIYTFEDTYKKIAFLPHPYKPSALE